jgi:DNA-binding IclR family transcriptional regulator
VDNGLGGIPMIRDASAHIQCRRVASYPGGDHTVFLGEVERIGHSPSKPLAFGRGKYLATSLRDSGEISFDAGTSNLEHIQAIRIATPIAAELANYLRETVCIAVWGNKGPTVIRWEESSRPVSSNLRTGVVLPLLASATGLVFAAHLPRALTEELIAQEMNSPGFAPRSTAEFDARLAEVREFGFGWMVGIDHLTEMFESPITALSAPVFDGSGTMVLALTVVSRGECLDAIRNGPVAKALRRAAVSLSGRLGFTQWSAPAMHALRRD